MQKAGLFLKPVFFFLFQPDEKGKFEGIFESLSPVNGLLSGDKVKPVLINSKLPLDVLGKVILHVRCNLCTVSPDIAELTIQSN